MKIYVNVIKAATKITRIENEKKNTMKKIITANIIAIKEMTLKIENDVEKKELRNITNVKFLKRIKRIIEK